MITGILVFFITIFYASAFGSIFRKRSTRKFIIVYCKPKLNSYVYQPFLSLVKTACRSILHSLLIRNYESQILTLFLIDLLFVAFCIKMKKYFINNLIFLCYLLYQLSFAAFDLFFYLESIQLI